jgi:transcriptional regulator with XRE-family HTH domain
MRRKRLMSLKYRALLLECFGQRLRMMRVQKGLTPSRFEAVSGIDAGNLAKYEEGLREPGLVTIVMIAKVLEVRPAHLLDFEFKFELEHLGK